MKKKNLKTILGLAMGFPGTILGAFFILQAFENHGIISSTVSTVILVIVMLNTLFLMILYASKK